MIERGQENINSMGGRTDPCGNMQLAYKTKTLEKENGDERGM